MLRFGLGLVFVGLVAAAQVAEADEDFFAPGLNLLTTRFGYSSTESLSPYQFSASVVLTRSPDTDLTGSESDSTPQLPSSAKPQQEITQAINTHWQQACDSSCISFSRLFGVEFKGAQANITFRSHSVLIGGEQFKITFRPQSALIEREQLKIILRPHSASMSWSKVF